MRNEDIADLESSLHQAEAELSVHVAKSKHVNAMADCVERALIRLEIGDYSGSIRHMKQALKHFAEWEK